MVKIVKSNPYEDDVSDEQITDSGRIALLLEKMSQHYSPITIAIPKSTINYSSCIVSVDKPYVLLDELIPASGHERLITEQKIHATGKLDGVYVTFSTQLVRVDEQNNMLTYYFKLPQELIYQQRRQAYRVRIPMSKQLRVLIDCNDGIITVGDIHDLSHGGIGNIIPEGRTKIKAGDIYECVIELPSGEWIYCTVEMRFVKTIPGKKRQFIGARFIDLSTIQNRLISRCISTLELEEIQKRAML